MIINISMGAGPALKSKRWRRATRVAEDCGAIRYLSIYLSISLSLSIYIYIYIHTYTHIQLYVYIYIYIHTYITHTVACIYQ